MYFLPATDKSFIFCVLYAIKVLTFVKKHPVR